MIDRNLNTRSYNALMGEAQGYLTITLDLDEPVEITDFARFFASIGNQFDEYIADNHPDLAGEARFFVREVRKGSVIADMIPDVPTLIYYMDAALIVCGFAELLRKRLKKYIGGERIEDATKKDIANIRGIVDATANNAGGKSKIETVKYENGFWKTSLELTFDTKEARSAVRTLEAHKQDLDAIESVDHSRVLMTFTRSDINESKIGRRSGEYVLIEEVSDRALPLVYGSDLAEQRLKHEIRDTESIYHKGFVVDVNVQTRNGGRPATYSVTAVHQVIPLPEDD